MGRRGSNLRPRRPLPEDPLQTFLPYPDFEETAKVLDYRRLGKQRVEAMQIVKAHLDPSAGWQNHPATRMWRGFSEGLQLYFNIISREWISRGYKHTMGFFEVNDPELPPWLGDEDFHSAHRAALLFKAPEHYSQFGWTEEPELNYVWPV